MTIDGMRTAKTELRLYRFKSQGLFLDKNKALME